MIFWAFVIGGAAAIVAFVYFLHNRQKVESAADRILTVPGSVKDAVAKVSPAAANAVQSAQEAAQSAANKVIDKVGA